MILERGSEFIVVGEAENGADAVQLCKKSLPDIVLMDIGLPGMNGIEATTELLRHCPGVKVIILSMFDDENSVPFADAVELGHVLAEEPTAQACFAKQWLRYALGVDAASIDATALEPLVSAFEASHLNMRELLVALVKSDAFRRRSR